MSLMLTLNFQEQQKFEEMSMITDLILSIELEVERSQEYTQKHYIVHNKKSNNQNHRKKKKLSIQWPNWISTKKEERGWEWMKKKDFCHLLIFANWDTEERVGARDEKTN